MELCIVTLLPTLNETRIWTCEWGTAKIITQKNKSAMAINRSNSNGCNLIWPHSYTFYVNNPCLLCMIYLVSSCNCSFREKGEWRRKIKRNVGIYWHNNTWGWLHRWHWRHHKDCWIFAYIYCLKQVSLYTKWSNNEHDRQWHEWEDQVNENSEQMR